MADNTFDFGEKAMSGLLGNKEFDFGASQEEDGVRGPSVTRGQLSYPLDAESKAALRNAIADGDIITVTGLNIGVKSWTQSSIFSVTDADTVAWGAGTFRSADGKFSFSIVAGNTGDMVAKTFIYLDTGVSITSYQTTTDASNAQGDNKVLIAIAENGTDNATFQVFNDNQLSVESTSVTGIEGAGWVFSGLFSVTDADTVAWGAGTLTTEAGDSYSISGSNTGNMVAKTYIYFDVNVSTTAFQTTTTPATAVGNGKILIAVAQNATGEAKFMVFNDNQYNIDAANIVANSITANELSTSITYAGVIVISTNGEIRSGQTDYNTGTGWWIGNDGGTPKFSIGNPTGDRFTWDGLELSVFGTFNIGGTTKTVDTIAELQDALDDVATAGGGTVYLAAGSYTLVADITVPAGVTLQGVSRDGVIIDCDTFTIKILGTDLYSTGTVTIANGATVVTGDSTVWTSGMVGRHIFLSGFWYEITARNSNTEIEIGEAYTGSALSGATYVISTIVSNASIRKITVMGASGSGITCAYAVEPNLHDLVIYGCAIGLNLDYVVYPNVFVTSTDNGVNGDFFNVFGFKIDFSVFDRSTSGAGLVLDTCGDATFIDSAMYGNTGNGMSLTDCSNIAFVSGTTSSNGGHGIEFVEGNSDLQFIAFASTENTGSGYKFTATSQRNIIGTSTIINNMEWAIDIDSGNNDNIIGPNTYSGDDVDVNTGFLFPATVGTNGGTDWTNQNNMKTSNNSYATAAANGVASRAYDFTFDVPEGSLILGFEVNSEAFHTGGDPGSTIRYSASPDGGSNFYGELVHTTSTVEGTTTLGSSTELFGRTWTASELSNTNFRLRVTATQGGTPPTWSLDAVSVKVYYRRPASRFIINDNGVGNEIL